MRRCASPFGIIPPEELQCNDVGEGDGIEAREAKLQPAVDSLASSMSYHPLVEGPEWKLFASFDNLDFSFVGGAIGVCRPVPQEVSEYVFFRSSKRGEAAVEAKLLLMIKE
jgi:hypothetical protein